MYSLPSTSKMCEPCAARDEERVAAHAAEGAHRRIDAAGDEFLRAAEELFGFGVVHAMPGLSAGPGG